jgi:TRAP transporter TAXI family solute receptor
MKRRGAKEYLTYFAPAVVLTLAGFAIAYQFIDPAPPRHITIATGQPIGAYYEMGKKYSNILARDGIKLEVKATLGSSENLKRIADGSGEVDVIFLQSGIASGKPIENLVSLGSIFYEPLWVLHRSEISVRHLSDLRGKKISAGIEGSGTKVLAQQLLALNGVTPGNSDFFQFKNIEAAEKLLAGEIDAAFFVAAFREHPGGALLRSSSVRLFNFRRADAYTTRFHFLFSLRLPEGSVYFEENMPEEDVNLIAPVAQLVVRKDFHPALIDLLLQAVEEAGSPAGIFEKQGEFPSRKYVDLPLSDDAKRYYNSGPPFLQQFLPFWLATFLSRMKIMLLPLVALLYPLTKVLPPVYRWRMRSRIYRWYDQLMEIDSEILQGNIGRQKDEYLGRLDEIEQQVSQVAVPRGYSRELYDMRVHIELMRQKLAAAETDGNRAPSGDIERL